MFFQSLSVKEKKALHDARDESRKAMKQANMSKRLDEAQNLLGNIVTDKPELPKELPARLTTPKSKTMHRKDRSPVSVRSRMSVKATAPTVKQPQGILKTRDVSPPQMGGYYDEMGYLSDDYMDDEWLRGPENIPMKNYAAPQHQQIAVQPVPEPKQVAVQPALEPRQVEAAKGRKPAGMVPRLRLHGSLDDVDEEDEPVKLQQTGETTGKFLVRLFV